MTLSEKINSGIKEAMLSRSQLRLDTLRMLKSKILAADARGNLSDSEVIKLFKTYYGNLQEALEQAQGANRPEIVDKLKTELSIVQEFLPKAPSHEETKTMVQLAIQNTGAKTRKDFGMVMQTIMKQNSSIDGKLAKDLINQFLTD